MIPQRKRTAVGLLVLLAVVSLTTACPSSNDLDKMAKASNELAHDCVLANRTTAEVFKARDAALVAKEQTARTAQEKAEIAASRKSLLTSKDRIADKLGVICEKGDKFNDFLIELDKKYPQGTLPPQDLSLVKQNLSELRTLYADIVADLLPFGAQKAVSELDKDLQTIEKVVNQ